MAGICETALYRPVKRFLEARGYEVKGEVCGVDLVARHLGDPEDQPPLIVELKRRFTLALLLQGIDRLAISDRVYVAVPLPARNARGLSPESPAIRRLCRRVGLGLIIVSASSIAVIEEPVPYRPRAARHRMHRLLTEFNRREGDPNICGSSRHPLITAYRQDALRLVRALAGNGPMPLVELRKSSGVAHAARIVRRNVYGWFVREERGVYNLSPDGHEALRIFADAAAALAIPAVIWNAAA
jgi:hypothetical protein